MSEKEKDLFEYLGFTDNKALKKLITRYKKARQLFKPVLMDIPFAKALSGFFKGEKTKKQEEQLLILIDMAALINRFDMQWKLFEQKCRSTRIIEADLQDYRKAYELFVNELQTDFQIPTADELAARLDEK